MLIKDVIQDFLKDKATDTEELEELFQHLSEKYGLDSLDLDDQYAIFSYALYRVFGNADGLLEADMEQSAARLDQLLGGRQESLLELSIPYRWLPDWMHEVYEKGKLLFEMAKKAYYLLDDVDEAEADKLLDEIVNAKEKLKKDSFAYCSRQEVEYFYCEELSECRLDADTAKGNDMIVSLRMGRYIENLKEMAMLNKSLELPKEEHT